MIGNPLDVRQVYFCDCGIIEFCRPGQILIDMTTSSPPLAKEIYEAAKAKGVEALDAPVTGAEIGAIKGTLTIMVGGDLATFERCISLFEIIGSKIVYHGAAGNGHHCKLANQITVAGAISGITEALAYAESNNLDQQLVLETMLDGSGHSRQMEVTGPKIINPTEHIAFYNHHFAKDLTLVNENTQLNLKMTTAVSEMFNELLKMGLSEAGFQSVIEYYRVKTT